MGKRSVLMLALAVLVIPGIASAEEIVHFSSGTSMAVRSHELKDGMVHVDLGSNGFMAFPEYMVESIDVAGKNIKLKASTNGGKAPEGPTIIASGPKGGAAPLRPKRTTPMGVNDGMRATELDEKGVATVRPFAGSNNARKRQMRTSGSSSVFSAPPQTKRNGNGLLGTTRVGSKHVIGGSARPGRRNKPIVTGISRVERARPQNQNQQDGSSDDSSGSDNDSAGSGSDD